MQENETWRRIDPSKMLTFSMCPRKYFYRYVLGWESCDPNLDKVFGEAWHRAKQYMFINGISKENIEGAMDRFLLVYRKYYPEHTDLDNHPKSPGNALTAILEYVDQYAKWWDLEVVEINGKPATEIYGNVLIDIDRMLHFRIDAICRNKHGIWFVDHKTSGSDRPIYQDAWRLSNQMYTYLHAIHCLFGYRNVCGGKVDLSIFRRSGNKHVRVLIAKDVLAMEGWLFMANFWYDLIMRETDAVLRQDCQDNPVMTAFPRNECGCTAYNRLCKYFDFCEAWQNPIQQTIPDGFVVDWWDPANVPDEAQSVGQIKQI